MNRKSLGIVGHVAHAAVVLAPILRCCFSIVGGSLDESFWHALDVFCTDGNQD